MAFLAKGLGVTYLHLDRQRGRSHGRGLPRRTDRRRRTRTLSPLFVEQIRRPQKFLELAQRARAKRKPIVVMHPGRSQRARTSASSHTGALAGDHAVMTALLRHAAVTVVETLDELLDTAELLARFKPPTKGPGIITNSGAIKGFALDFCDRLGLDIPRARRRDARSAEGCAAAVRLARQSGRRDRAGAARRHASGPAPPRRCLPIPRSAACAFRWSRARRSSRWTRSNALLPVMRGVGQAGRDRACSATTFRSRRSSSRRSAARAFRCCARPNARCARSPRDRIRAGACRASWRTPRASRRLPCPRAVRCPSTRAKPIWRRSASRCPTGALARDVADANEIAARIGYPVALKAQAAALAHKSDAGGVALNIADAAALERRMAPASTSGSRPRSPASRSMACWSRPWRRAASR